jgi:hypothetical protein
VLRIAYCRTDYDWVRVLALCFISNSACIVL